MQGRCPVVRQYQGFAARSQSAQSGSAVWWCSAAQSAGSLAPVDRSEIVDRTSIEYLRLAGTSPAYNPSADLVGVVDKGRSIYTVGFRIDSARRSRESEADARG